MTEDTPTIAEQLKSARLASGRPLKAFADELKIRARYLEALEEGRNGDLPAPAFTAGFVRSYAGQLGLDGASLARAYREQFDAAAVGPELNFPEPLAESRLPGRAVLLSAMAGLAAIYFGWIHQFGAEGGARIAVAPVPERLAALIDEQTGQPAAVAVRRIGYSPAAETPAAEAEPTSERVSAPAERPAAAEPKPSAPAAAAPVRETVPAVAVAKPAAKADGHVVLTATSDTWMFVVDGENAEVWKGVLRAGQSWSPRAPGFKLMTSNAGALQITVDGRPVEPLGATGAVVRDVPLDAERLRKRDSVAMR